MAATSSRASHAAIASGNAAVSAGFNALRASGRLRVTTATRSLTSTRITSSSLMLLPSRPSGFALLEERGHAFADVVAGADGIGGGARRLPAELVAFGDRALERAQAGAGADRPDRADARRERERTRHCLARLGDDVHQPERVGPLGGKPVAGEQHLFGDVERQR